MAWLFVCPASRGIGFHLTRNLLKTTTLPIVATARRDIEAVRTSLLRDIPDVDSKHLTVLEVDVTNEDSIAAAASRAKALFPPPSHHLRLALTLPGILHPEKSPSQITSSSLHQTFATNLIGPLLLLKHFSPFLPTKSSSQTHSHSSLPAIPGLPDHALYVLFSARVGSTSENALGGWYSYRASKAGVNSVTKTFDMWLKNRAGERAMAIAYHPGTVRTGLSKDFWGSVEEVKLFSPEQATEYCMSVVRSKGPEARGRCWDWKGQEIPP